MLWRSLAKAALVLALGYGFARGVLGLFTDLEWSVLTPTEQRVVVAAIGLPLLAVVALIGVRAWRVAARDAYFADLGFGADVAGVHRLRGGWFGAHAGTFEAADGARRPAWVVDAQALRRGKEVVYYAKDPPGAGGTNELDDETRAALDGLTELVQLRVTPKMVRVVLERDTPPPNLRRAIAVVGMLAGQPVPAGATVLPPVPTAHELSRGAPSYLYAVAAAAAYIVAVIVVAFLAPDAEGYEDFILARTRACGLAREALGEPIERTQFGWQPSTGANRHKTSRLLVKGPRSEGTIIVHSYRRRRGMDSRVVPIIDAVMDVAGNKIEVLACSRAWKSGIDAPRSWKARKRAAPGSSCDIRVAPSPKPGFQECRVELECDGRALYGATVDLGFADCWTVRDRGRDDVVVSDPDRGLDRPEPTLELDERTGIAKAGIDVLEIQ